MTEIPPMNSVASHILKEQYIKRIPELSEEDFMKFAKGNFFKKNKANPQGALLTRSIHLWLAKLEGSGGKGRQILPVGVEIEGKLAREFNTNSQPPIILERDYPGATIEQATNIFLAQALALYRTESRSSSIGPDMTALLKARPITTMNSEREGENQEFITRQSMMRVRYANTVLPVLDMLLPSNLVVQFDSIRGRHEEVLSQVQLGRANKATGLGIESVAGNVQQQLVAMTVKSDTVRNAIDGAIQLTRVIERDLQGLCFVCSKGNNAILYVGGGPIGTFSKNELYDFLGSLGKMVGAPAINSKIPYKDIDLPLYGVVIDKESFTERTDDAILLPMSLDIDRARPKMTTTKAFEGSNDVYNQSGLVILPVFNAESFDPGYDDHPMVAQYRRDLHLPSVIEYLQAVGLAYNPEYVPATLVDGDDKWTLARNENVKVKEASIEDFLTANEVYSIPHGRECVLIFDGTKASLQVGKGEKMVQNIPQTREFEWFCNSFGLAPLVAKGVLTPRDGRNFALIDQIIAMEELPDDEFSTISMFGEVEVRIFDVLEGELDDRIKALTMPHVKVCRHQSSSFAEISDRASDLAYREMVVDELGSGYASRLLLIQESGSLNYYGEQTIDAAVIAFDLEGKNPQNGIVGNVVLAVNSIESIRVGKRKKSTELFSPIGVTNAFRGFSVEAKKEIFTHLLKNATHSGFGNYMLVDPVKANLVVNVEFKGLSQQTNQPIYRYFTEVSEYKGERTPVPLHHEKGMGRWESTEKKVERIKIPTFTDVIPGMSYLVEVGQREMPMLKNPVITSLGTTIDSLTEYFEESKSKYEVRSSRKSPLSLPVPLEQIKRNGPEPVIGEFDFDSKGDEVSHLLYLSMNPPTENWSAHRQRVPWDFDQDAFDGTAFRTFQMDDPDDRRKAIHMDGWNRRYDDYEGVQAIAGKLESTGKWHIQTIRVPRIYKLRRLRKEIQLDEQKPPAWYKKLRPNTKPFGTKSNPPFWSIKSIDDDIKDWEKWLHKLSKIRAENMRDEMAEISELRALLEAGQISVEEGRAKFEEIKARYPKSNPPKEIPRFLYHGSPVAELKVLEARLDPVFAKRWKESGATGDAPKTVFLTEEPYQAEWYALGGYQRMKHTYTDGSDQSFRDEIAQTTMDEPTPGVIYQIETKGIDNLVPVGHGGWVVFNRDVPVHDYKSIEQYSKAGVEWMTAPHVIKNPIIPHDYMKAMDEGWTGYPWWAIAPTISAHELRGILSNPKTPKGRKFPKKYLKGLNKVEKAIAMYEIDRGYEYDVSDPDAYKYWKSDIMAKAKGVEGIPSQHRIEFAKRYGPLPKGKDLPTKLAKATGIKKKFIKEAYNRGLAAWRIGHPPGVQQHQWASGRAYHLVMASDSTTAKGGPDFQLAVEAGIRTKDGKVVKNNPSGFTVRFYARGTEQEVLGGRFQNKHRFIAFDGEKAVGLLIVDGDYPLYITNFGVLDDYQKQGIGNQLLAALVERFPDDTILLHMTPTGITSEKLAGLYEKYGFVPHGKGKSGLSAMIREPKSNPPGIPKPGKELPAEKKREIRKKWLELVNMTQHELQTFYDSNWGNKKAGLSREQAKQQGISSGRDSALAILKMKETPVKEWSKKKSKDRGRGIMLDYWQWAQKQINFNTRHRGMQGAYLDDKGRPKRKLLGLWIWGHDPWRYARKVSGEKMGEAPNFPWIGRKEKDKYGLRPTIARRKGRIQVNPLVLKPLYGDILSISGPSGSGKSTLASGIVKKLKAIRIPSYMTRAKRPQEKAGEDGIFVSKEEFEMMMENGDFTTANGENLWVQQKNGEYYGRKASDFITSKPIVLDVNFEGLRLLRRAFPDRVYSVFINTGMGEERRRKMLEKRGVHSEEEITQRVKAGTGMLNSFQDLNFDFISRNRFGELDKNIKMIASEFKKWRNRPLNNPPIMSKGTAILHKPSGQKMFFEEVEIDEYGTWYHLVDEDGAKWTILDDELDQYSLYPTAPYYKANPVFPKKRHGSFPETTLSTHSPTEKESHDEVQKHQKRHDTAVQKEMRKKFPRWSFTQKALEGKDGQREKKALIAARKKVDKDIGPFVLCPEHCKYCMIEQNMKSNPDHEKGEPKFTGESIVRDYVKELDPSIEFTAATLEERLKNAGYKKAPGSRTIGRKILPQMLREGLIVRTSFSGSASYRNSERNYLSNPPAKDVKWDVKYYPFEKSSEMVRLIGPNLIIKGVHPDGKTEVEILIAIYELGKRFKKVTKPDGTEDYLKFGIDPQDGSRGYNHGDKALYRYDWIQSQGFKNYGHIQGIGVSHPNDYMADEGTDDERIIHVGAGKGMGQAAYLYAAKVLAKRGMPLVSVSPSESATRAWDKLEENLPTGYHMKRAGLSTAKVKTSTPIRLLWYDGPLDNPPVFDDPRAMDMGIQYGDKTAPNLEGKAASSKWHNQMLDGKMSKMPEIANDWKKKSFKAEFGLDGFIEKFGNDPRPYIVSLKIDGDSSLAHFDGKETVLWNKRGRWRRNFHVTDEITASLKKAGVKSAIIMGELYAVGEDGMTLSLKEVSSTILKPETIERQQTIRFAAFDLIELNGQDTFSMPYHERMKMIPKLKGSGVMTVPMWFSKGGLKELKEAWDEGMKEPNFEGLILRYEGDPKSYKIKEKGTADLAVIGFYRGKAGGRDENIVGGGMLAWMLPNGDFIYAGKSVIGSSIAEKEKLVPLLLDDAVKAPKAKLGGRLVDSSITHDQKGKGTFTMVKPTMVGEFQYRGINWSEKPAFRFENGEVKQVGMVKAPTMFQPSFKRWRTDKEIKPEHLRIEQIPLEGTGKWGQIKPNPPATDIEWTVKISPKLPEKSEWLFGTWEEAGQVPSVVMGMGGERVLFRRKNELASAWILLSGKNADGEIKVILSVFEDLKGLVDLYPSLHRHKTETEKLGLKSLALVEQIETKSKGKGIGQAAYLKAAQLVSNRFDGVLATGNHSLDAEKAWRGVERNLPAGHKIERWIMGEYPEWEVDNPFSYARILYATKQNPPATNLEWEHRRGGPKGLQTLFGRDETGGGVAVRFTVRDGRARVESIGLRDQASMAIDSGMFEGKQLTDKQIQELERIDGEKFFREGLQGLKLVDGVWSEDLDYAPSNKGKGYGQAAYLKLLDYADEVYSRWRSAKATRAWEALEKRQDELGIVVERHRGVGRQGGDAFLMRRAKQNPPGDLPEDIEYPGGHSQYLMDGILIGSITGHEKKRGKKIGKWYLKHPELAARLIEAEKKGWTIVPRTLMDVLPKANPDHDDDDEDDAEAQEFDFDDRFEDEEAFEEAYASDREELRQQVQDRATEEERTYFIQARKVEGAYQLIISPNKEEGADLLDIVEPAIIEKGSIKSWQKGLESNPPKQRIMIPKIVIVEHYTPELVRQYPNYAFLFGDNEKRSGTGGQAVIRNEPNAIGVRTKKSARPNIYWSDKHKDSSVKMMSEDFLRAFNGGYDAIVIPSNGLGTGLAKLKEKAPQTFKWLASFVNELKRLAKLNRGEPR